MLRLFTVQLGLPLLAERFAVEDLRVVIDSGLYGYDILCLLKFWLLYEGLSASMARLSFIHSALFPLISLDLFATLQPASETRTYLILNTFIKACCI